MTATHIGVPLPRVLHVVDNLGVGGTELTLARLIERTRDRFDHTICCIREVGARRERFEAAGATVLFVGKSAGHDWRVPLRIGRICRSLRPAIVHTRNWGTIEGALAARLAGMPIVIHGEHGRDQARGASFERRRDRARRLLFPLLNRIVVVSKELERWLIEEIRVPAHKAVYIPNGVDTDKFRPSLARQQLRQKHGYSTSDFVIGAVGRLHSVKNYVALLAAFEAVLRQHPEAWLAIVGEGEERPRLAAEIERRGWQDRARLVGHQEDVRDWLGAMDLFVQCSLMEGSSNAILEAMSSGLAVVATRVGGNPDVVQSTTGHLVAADDVAELAAAISQYCRMPQLREEHGRGGRERVLDQYPIDRMVGAYAALYDEMLRSSTAPRHRVTPRATS